jgi:thymidylate kinase
MYKCLVFEGCDGSGKSTAINNLLADTPYSVYHGGGPPKTGLQLLQSHIAAINWMDEQNAENDSMGFAVFDRIRPTSEMIYGPVVRGRQFFNDNLMWKWMAEYNPVFIFMCPPFDVVWERGRNMPVKDHKSEAHVKHIVKNLHEVYEAYISLFKRIQSHYPVFVLDSPADPEEIDEIALCVG